jgi:hypothetical protein
MFIFLGHQEVLLLLLFSNHLLFHLYTVIISSMGMRILTKKLTFFICRILDVVYMSDQLNQRVNRVTINSNVQKQVGNNNNEDIFQASSWFLHYSIHVILRV